MTLGKIQMFTRSPYLHWASPLLEYFKTNLVWVIFASKFQEKPSPSGLPFQYPPLLHLLPKLTAVTKTQVLCPASSPSLSPGCPQVNVT